MKKKIFFILKIFVMVSTIAALLSLNVLAASPDSSISAKWMIDEARVVGSGPVVDCPTTTNTSLRKTFGNENVWGFRFDFKNLTYSSVYSDNHIGLELEFSIELGKEIYFVSGSHIGFKTTLYSRTTPAMPVISYSVMFKYIDESEYERTGDLLGAIKYTDMQVYYPIITQVYDNDGLLYYKFDFSPSCSFNCVGSFLAVDVEMRYNLNSKSISSPVFDLLSSDFLFYDDFMSYDVFMYNIDSKDYYSSVSNNLSSFDETLKKWFTDSGFKNAFMCVTGLFSKFLDVPFMRPLVDISLVIGFIGFFYSVAHIVSSFSSKMSRENRESH